MLTIFVLFVGLTLATAVIAYWSDNLGKKLGKKRVSLWGMRPRTTATFLTIASSWLIMIFTLGVMLALFKPLRRSLLRYDDVLKSTTTLKAQVIELSAQTEDLKNQASDAASKLANVQEKLMQSREAVTQARKASTQAQKEAVQASKNAAAATKRQQAAAKNEQEARDNLQKVSGQLNATQQQRAAALQQLSAAKTNLNKANADVKSADAQVKNANARVKFATAKVAKAQLDLAKAQQNEKIAKANADEAQTRAKNARDSALTSGAEAVKSYKASIEAQKQVVLAQKQVIQAKKKVDELEEQSKKLIEDNKTLLAENENFADVADVLLLNDVRVPVGTVLAAKNFAQGASFYQAKDDLDALFARADEIVSGYKDNDKNVPPLLPDAKLTLSPRLVPAPDADGSDAQKFVSVEGEEIYNGLARTISSSQNPLSVRLVSERNHLLGDKILSARFVVVPIRSALPANDLLVSARIDGTSNDARIFKNLSDLADAARDVAAQQGVAPPLWRDSRNFYASGSNEQVFDALRQIKAINGPVRVRIVTEEPISTADLLSVKFEVEPINAVTTTATARLVPRSTPIK